jgi:hypothetical protein
MPCHERGPALGRKRRKHICDDGIDVLSGVLRRNPITGMAARYARADRPALYVSCSVSPSAVRVRGIVHVRVEVSNATNAKTSWLPDFECNLTTASKLP